MKHPQTLLLSAIEDIKVCIVAKEFEILFARKSRQGNSQSNFRRFSPRQKRTVFQKFEFSCKLNYRKTCPPGITQTEKSGPK